MLQGKTRCTKTCQYKEQLQQAFNGQAVSTVEASEVSLVHETPSHWPTEKKRGDPDGIFRIPRKEPTRAEHKEHDVHQKLKII